ncbi:hypothetical protein [Diaphorobacter aerolatus]|uniref:Uncharacterized protein n=1 Tax=Diaphorobacter aerolatus TaxID=1288495 RepID=A0A7H0GMH5_9BURK|nr:hypothetical protein [Diaphorobacter aerolatus]QNP49491.1 hypothetical protein H9K75_05660 [Diaphorobacter aerolatus]
MTPTPSIITDEKIIKYNIKTLDFDIEDELKARSIPFTSWGRILVTSATNQYTYNFSDDATASEIEKNLVKNEVIKGPRVIIVWSNAIKPVLSSKIELLKDYSLEIVTEDWDFWIFGDHWILEKYHEGELILINFDSTLKSFL